MLRQMNKLTPKTVTHLTKPGLYGDGGGLALQITPPGVKSWLFRFMIAGKAKSIGLGPTHTVSLAEARQKALEARKQLIEGIIPLTVEEKRTAAALVAAKMMTFDQSAAAFILAHKAEWKNERHTAQWQNTLATYASPIIGALPVAEIDTGLVVKCLAPIWEDKDNDKSKPAVARALRGRIEAVLDWAGTSGYRSGENPARWKGHLENLLSKKRSTSNHPSLPWQDIGAFMSGLRASKGVGSRALELAILTACRSAEVRGARWSEIDLAGKVWKIPAGRMKAKREHEVPLSDAAVALLKAMPKDGELVFPGIRGQELRNVTLSLAVKGVEGEWLDAQGNGITVHGFRSTFRMWAAETTNFPREVAEHALAHQLPDAVERAYQRGSQFAKRVALMADWAAYCSTVPVAAGVVPIRSVA